MKTKKTTAIAHIPALQPDEDEEEGMGLDIFSVLEKWIGARYQVRLNVVRNDIEMAEAGKDEFGKINENDIFIKLYKSGLRPSKAILSILLGSKFVQEFDPIRAYFEGVKSKWDKTGPDVIGKLARFVSVKEAKYWPIDFKKHLVRTVACAVNPKYYNKHALILVGRKQNTGKTSFCRFLMPPGLANYNTDTFPLNGDKDAQISLAQNLLINLDELSTLAKSEINQLKSIFSLEKINIRRPYAANTTEEPRRASFIGSTNRQEFLSDETGNVRWICHELLGIDFAYSKEVEIDQVWAQAYHLYLSGFDMQLSEEDIKRNEGRNQDFRTLSTEFELLVKNFEQAPSKQKAYFKTSTDILIWLQQRYPQVKLVATMVGKACSAVGWERQSLKTDKGSQYGYYVTQKVDTKDEF